jgi:hypothetical protein
MHSAVVRLGFEQDSPLVDRIIFKGEDLHECYDTRHVFEHDPEQVTTTWLGPRYFIPLPPRRLTLGQRIAAAFRGKGGRKSSGLRASSRPESTWPVAVLNLPPGSRWRVAQVLARAGERARTAHAARARAPGTADLPLQTNPASGSMLLA